MATAKQEGNIIFKRKTQWWTWKQKLYTRRTKTLNYLLTDQLADIKIRINQQLFWFKLFFFSGIENSKSNIFVFLYFSVFLFKEKTFLGVTKSI